MVVISDNKNKQGINLTQKKAVNRNFYKNKNPKSFVVFGVYSMRYFLIL